MPVVPKANVSWANEVHTVQSTKATHEAAPRNHTEVKTLGASVTFEGEKSKCLHPTGFQDKPGLLSLLSSRWKVDKKVPRKSVSDPKFKSLWGLLAPLLVQDKDASSIFIKLLSQEPDISPLPFSSKWWEVDQRLLQSTEPKSAGSKLLVVNCGTGRARSPFHYRLIHNIFCLNPKRTEFIKISKQFILKLIFLCASPKWHQLF